MSQPTPPAGWYPDPGNSQQLRYWSGSAWTEHTQPNGQTPPPVAPAAYAVPYAAPPVATPSPWTGSVPQRQVSVTAYNQRMANRVARRAHLNEPAVAVAFTYNNLATMLTFGLVEDVAQVVPSVGQLLELALSLLSFYFHRIVIVTSTRVYIYRDWPLHFPGKQLAAYQRGPGLVRMGSGSQQWFSRLIRRGELTFQDGTVVYHSPIWIRRAHYIAQEGNIPPGQ